jgi:hypothetical protein
VTRERPAEVRYYLDADVLGLAKIMVQVRPDCTYPGDPGGVLHKRRRPPSPITTPKTLDPDWIREVARRGWLIVTRDSNIQGHRAEIGAVRESGAKMIALAGKDSIGTWAQLGVLLHHWRRIEMKADEQGPFIYSATRTSFRSVPLS